MADETWTKRASSTRGWKWLIVGDRSWEMPEAVADQIIANHTRALAYEDAVAFIRDWVQGRGDLHRWFKPMREWLDKHDAAHPDAERRTPEPGEHAGGKG